MTTSNNIESFETGREEERWEKRVEIIKKRDIRWG